MMEKDAPVFPKTGASFFRSLLRIRNIRIFIRLYIAYFVHYALFPRLISCVYLQYIHIFAFAGIFIHFSIDFYSLPLYSVTIERETSENRVYTPSQG